MFVAALLLHGPHQPEVMLSAAQASLCERLPGSEDAMAPRPPVASKQLEDLGELFPGDVSVVMILPHQYVLRRQRDYWIAPASIALA